MDHPCDVPVAVQQELDGLRVHLRQTEALRGFGRLLLLGTGLLVCSLAADFLLDLETQTRAWLLAGQVLLCLVAGGLGIARPLLRRIPDSDVAALAERKFPELGERLTSLIELSDDRLPDSERGSALMREMLQREAVQTVGRTDLPGAVDSRRAVRPTVLGMFGVAACVFWLLLFPEPSRLLLARLLNPVGNYASAGPLTFEIVPDDCVVGRGSDVAVSVAVGWRDGREEPVPEPVTMLWENTAGQAEERELRFDADADAFVAVVPDAQESFRFRVAAGGTRSKSVDVRVEEMPRIVTATLEATPAPYVGRPRQSFDGVTGEMVVFERSQLVFDLTFNKPVSTAELEWLGALIIPADELKPAAAQKKTGGSEEDAKRAVPRVGPYRNELVAADELPRNAFQIADDGLSASLRTSATVQGTLAFRLTDQSGLSNSDEPFRYVKIERDQPPLLEIAGGAQDTARPSDVYPLEVAVTDDVGVDELELVITAREGLETVQEVPTEDLGQRTLTHRFRVDLADLGVEAGTVLRLQVRAADGRPLPSPNEVWSTVRYVAVSNDADAPGTNDLLAQQEQLRTELRSIREGLQQATEASDDLQKQASQAAESGEPLLDAEKIDEFAQREAALTERLQQLADRLRERPLFDKVAETAQQTVGRELTPQVERLQAARDATAQEQATTLNANADATDLAAEQLLELESRFDRLAQLEQDLLELNRISERAGRLSDDAEQLADLRGRLDAARRQSEANAANADPVTTDSANARSSEGDSGSNQNPVDGGADDAARLATAQSELAAAQQQLQNEHRELAAALAELLDDRPEILNAARDRQLEQLRQLSDAADRLAEREELLARAFNEGAAEQLSGPDEASASEGGSPNEASGSSSDDSRSDNSSPDNLVADSLPTLDELLERQGQLAAEAAELGLAAAESQGQESPAATSAIESALSSMQAQQQAQGGQFGEAARMARQAAESAQQAQAALAEQQPALASRAEDVAAGEQQLAHDFEALQNSETRRMAARQAQQEQLAEAAGELAEQLGRSAESLAAEPLGLNEPGQNAAQARQAAESATQSAAQAAENLQNGSAVEAAQAAQQSAEALREAAANAAGREPAADFGENAAVAGSDSDAASSQEQPMPGDAAGPANAASPENAGSPANAAAPENAAAPGNATASSDAPRGSRADDVPGELATQVVAATQQLLQAQQRIGEAIAAAELPAANAASDGDNSATAQGNPSQAAQGQSGQSQSEQGQSEQGGPAGESGEQAVASNGTPAADAGQSGSSQSEGGSSGQGSEGSANDTGQRSQGGESSNGTAADSASGGPVGQQGSPASDALRRAAQSLAEAAGLLSEVSRQFAPQSGQGQGEPGRGMSNGENSRIASELGSDGSGAAGFEEAESPLELQLRQQVMRDWGRLPVKLRTEVLQSSDRKTNSEYSEIIKLYFEQIAVEEAGKSTGNGEQRAGNSR